jgi:hypothetical protein
MVKRYVLIIWSFFLVSFIYTHAFYAEAGQSNLGDTTLHTAQESGIKPSITETNKNIELNHQAKINRFLNVYTLIGWLIVVIIGVVLGFKQKITVFRDYNDLGLVFLIGLSPIVLTYLFSFVGGEQEKIAITFIILIEAVLFLWIVIRTFKDNPNVLGTLVALITKISLSVLFIINFLAFVSPQGKNYSERAKSRRNALAILLIVAPLVFGLVKNKKGIFNPEQALARRGVGV